MIKQDKKSNGLTLMMLILIVSLCLMGLVTVILGVTKSIGSWERDFRLPSGMEEELIPGQTSVYQFDLPDNPSNRAIYCQGSFQFASIWINGSFAGEYPGEKNIASNLGLWDAIIPLPEGDVSLRFEVMSPYEMYQGEMLKAYVATEQDINRYLLSESLYRLSFTIFGIVMGFFFIIISIAGRISYNDDLALMSFGIFIVFYSVLFLFHEGNPDHFVCALFTPRTVGNVSFFLLYAILLPNIVIFAIKSVYFKRTSTVIMAVVFLFFIIVCSAQVLGIKTFPEFLHLRQILVLSYSAFFCLSTMIEYKKGNGFAIWLFVWISVTMTAYVFDIFHVLKRIGMPDILISYIFIFMMAIFVLARSIAEDIKRIVYEKTELHNTALRNQMILERYDNARNYMEQIKQVRHEIKNQFIMLKLILDQGDMEKAKKYVQELAREEENYKPIIYSENYLIDGIVGSAAVRAEKNNIRFSYYLPVPSEINFSEKKLNSFLVNLLDNAIESCCRKADDGNRFISLSIKKKGAYLCVQCSNTKGNEIVRQSGQFISSKLDKSNHGYGLKIMEQIAVQSGGVLEVKDDEETFAVNAILKLMDTEDENMEAK